jgi:hypothetical protein
MVALLHTSSHKLPRKGDGITSLRTHTHTHTHTLRHSQRRVQQRCEDCPNMCAAASRTAHSYGSNMCAAVSEHMDVYAP